MIIFMPFETEKKIAQERSSSCYKLQTCHQFFRKNFEYILLQYGLVLSSSSCGRIAFISAEWSEPWNSHHSNKFQQISYYKKNPKNKYPFSSVLPLSSWEQSTRHSLHSSAEAAAPGVAWQGVPVWSWPCQPPWTLSGISPQHCCWTSAWTGGYTCLQTVAQGLNSQLVSSSPVQPGQRSSCNHRNVASWFQRCNLIKSMRNFGQSSVTHMHLGQA